MIFGRASSTLSTLSPRLARPVAASSRLAGKSFAIRMYSGGLSEYKGKCVTLNTGQRLPQIGLGTFQDPDEQEHSVLTAIKNGYRHIDTAHNYGTEKQVGAGIRKSGVPRDQIFITTKLWCNAHHPDDVEPALNDSLSDLGTDYVDLYLMHYPCSFQRGPEFEPLGPDGKVITDPTPYIDTWKAMEKLLKTGKTKAIGVSNFSQREIEKVIKEGSVVPAVHQTELHPYLQQKAFVDWHADQGIKIIQFSPSGNLNPFYRDVSWAKSDAQMTRLIDHPLLIEVAKKHGKSPIQISLAWSIAGGRCVIPKSTIEWQIQENVDSENIQLDAEDMAKIAKMDQKARFNDPGPLFGYKLYQGLDGALP